MELDSFNRFLKLLKNEYLLKVRCLSIPGIPTPDNKPHPLHNKINERAKFSGWNQIKFSECRQSWVF